MKKKIFSTMMIAALLMFPLFITAQTKDPGDPPGGGGDPGGDPIGGGAPIGSGLVILLTMGAVYGGKKLYTLYTEDKESLEE